MGKLWLMDTERLRKTASGRELEDKFEKLIEDGVIKNFDEEFFSKFGDLRFYGIPVNYFLRVDNIGQCEASASVLTLLLDGESDICKGNLKLYNTKDLHHVWVEKDGMVYDTTWQIICPKKVYYQIYQPFKIRKMTNKKYYKKHDRLEWRVYTTEELKKLDRIPVLSGFEDSPQKTLKKISEAKTSAERDSYQQIYDKLPKVFKEIKNERTI